LSKKFMKETKMLLEKNYDIAEAIAQELLEKETISGEDILELIRKTRGESEG